MRCFIWIGTGILLAAIAIGCGPGKELPDTHPDTKTPVGPPADPGGPVPAASEPKAKEVADRALKAITNDNLTLASKGRISKVTAKGTLVNITGLKAECTRVVQTVWPDRARVTYTFTDTALGKTTFGTINHSGWMDITPTPAFQPSTTPTEIATWTENDLLAQHWFLLGLPFTESSAIYFDLQIGKIALRAANFIKVGLPNRPVYQIAFDDQTGLPVMIHYAPVELDPHKRSDKVVEFFEHELDSSGFRLPKRLVMKQNNNEAENWTVEKWEFPDKLEESVFSSVK